MSRPHSGGSPFYMRNTNLHGRRGDGFYVESYHSDAWRGPENIIKQEENWEKSHSQEEEQVDHWAMFIEAIGRAGKPRPSSALGFQKQEVQNFEKISQSPRNHHRENVTSPEASRYGAETHQRFQPPGWRKNKHYSRDSNQRQLQGKRHDRLERDYPNEGRDRYPNKDSYIDRSQKSKYEYSPQPKRLRELDHHSDYTHRGTDPSCAPIIVERDHGFPQHKERNKNRGELLSLKSDQSRNRNPSRSLDSETNRRHSRSRDPPVSRDSGMNQGHSRNMNPLGSRDLGKNRGHSRSRESSRSHDPDMKRRHSRTRNFSVGNDRVMNHEHPRRLDPLRTHNPVGDYQHQRSKDPPNNSNLQRERNFSRSYETSKEREPLKHWRDFDHHAGMPREKPSGSSHYNVQEETTFQNFLVERGIPVRGRSQQRDEHRMSSHPRQSCGGNTLDLNSDVDLRMDDNRTRLFAHEEMQPGGNHGDKRKQGVHQHRERRIDSEGGDFRVHETLMIKVDMSRPVAQSRYGIAATGYEYG